MREINPIKLARLTQGMTQLQLARLLGVGEGTISYWETQRCRPTLEHLKKLADILEVPITRLEG